MRRFLFAVLFGLCAVSVSTASYAASSNGNANNGNANNGKQSTEVEKLTLEQAAERLRKKVGGRVLGAKTVTVEERSLYEIKILLKPGKVRVYRVDPMGGKIL